MFLWLILYAFWDETGKYRMEFLEEDENHAFSIFMDSQKFKIPFTTLSLKFCGGKQQLLCKQRIDYGYYLENFTGPDCKDIRFEISGFWGYFYNHVSGVYFNKRNILKLLRGENITSTAIFTVTNMFTRSSIRTPIPVVVEEEPTKSSMKLIIIISSSVGLLCVVCGIVIGIVLCKRSQHCKPVEPSVTEEEEAAEVDNKVYTDPNDIHDVNDERFIKIEPSSSDPFITHSND